jgi:hypothetical protein
MSGLGKGGVPLLFLTLWVASGKIESVTVTLLPVRSVFRTHKISIDVDSSRGVFVPLSGGKAHMAKNTLDPIFLASVPFNINHVQTQKPFGSVKFSAVDDTLALSRTCVLRV